MMTLEHLAIGQIYDLRTPGQIERELPPNLWEVIEFDRGRLYGDDAIICRSIPLGVIRGFPVRHFTPSHAWRRS